MLIAIPSIVVFAIAIWIYFRLRNYDVAIDVNRGIKAILIAIIIGFAISIIFPPILFSGIHFGGENFYIFFHTVLAAPIAEEALRRKYSGKIDLARPFSVLAFGFGFAFGEYILKITRELYQLYEHAYSLFIAQQMQDFIFDADGFSDFFIYRTLGAVSVFIMHVGISLLYISPFRPKNTFLLFILCVLLHSLMNWITMHVYFMIESDWAMLIWNLGRTIFFGRLGLTILRAHNVFVWPPNSQRIANPKN